MTSLRHGRKPQMLAAGALTALVVSGAALVTLHIAAAARGDMPKYLSGFAERPLDWLWAVGLTCLAAAGALTALAMRDLLPDTARARLGQMLMWITSVGAVGVVLLPANGGGTPQDHAHAAAAAPTFTALMIAPFALSRVFASDAWWAPLGRVTRMAAIALLGSLFALGVSYLARLEAVWFFERVAFLVGFVWIAVIARHVRDLRFAPASDAAISPPQDASK